MTKAGNVEDIETLRNIGDPIERAKTAGDLLDRHQQLVSELSDMRREAIEAAHDELGLNYREVASKLALSKYRISQIHHTPDPSGLSVSDQPSTKKYQ